MGRPRTVKRVQIKECPECHSVITSANCPKCGAAIRESRITGTKVNRHQNKILHYRTCQKCGENYCTEQDLYLHDGKNPMIVTRG